MCQFLLIDKILNSECIHEQGSAYISMYVFMVNTQRTFIQSSEYPQLIQNNIVLREHVGTIWYLVGLCCSMEITRCGPSIRWHVLVGSFIMPVSGAVKWQLGLSHTMAHSELLWRWDGETVTTPLAWPQQWPAGEPPYSHKHGTLD